jgi:hypothetical protein
MADRPASLLGAMAATVAYFLVVVPVGVISAPLWRRRLRVGWQPGAGSYWVPRTAQAPWRQSMREQR